MNRLYNDGITLKDLEQHSMLITLVYDLFSKQAQPKFIKECTKDGIVFDLRNNVSKMQMQRLILEPLMLSIPEYSFEIDYQLKLLRVERNVKAKSSKPVAEANASAA